MRIAALYARVSGEQQRDSNTIASQTEALIAYAERHGYHVAPDMIIEDDGYSGAVLERPGLERVRDLVAEGRIDTVLVHAPDRLSRRYAYQVLLIEELARQGVETVFLRAPSMETPEDHLLVQFQGMIAKWSALHFAINGKRTVMESWSGPALRTRPARPESLTISIGLGRPSVSRATGPAPP